ncbi:MAG: DUF1275 domain-containing protein [Proteobacteria bacterium]|nr:DUF1275 domain-containing protein [Pseudomonadota bacterium]
MDASLRTRNRLLVLLAAVGGCLDGLSYLRLDHVFTANMTGNTVLLALALGQRDWPHALRALLAVFGYVLGVAGGALLVELQRGVGHWPHSITRAFALEAGVLAVFAMVSVLFAPPPHTPLRDVLIILSGLAMGVQSAAVRGLQVSGVATTFITGTITSLVARLTHWAADIEIRHVHANAHGSGLLAAVWVAYFLAALGCGALAMRWPRWVALFPVCALVVVVAAAARRFGED